MSRTEALPKPAAPAAGFFHRSAPVLAIVAVALLSGCANRDSITVGSVPDDYRTNHPIVIGEKEQILDLPVAVDQNGASRSQKVALEGFLDGYDRSARPLLQILAPVGSVNEGAASGVAHDFAAIARKNGVPSARISVAAYQANAGETSAPVRVSFVALKAHTGKCGRWPDDLTKTEENKHYANFGCSYQNNLAAQIANPADLLGPRKPGDIDAANRSSAIDDYRARDVSAVFVETSEVDY